MKSPAFQFYPADYTSSQRVRLLTLEEEGAYINLLCSCWLHGSIPADPEMAARLIGKGCSTTLATTVLTMFTPSIEPGRLVHSRLERERLKQSDWREKSASGGRKSAELRKGASTTVQPPLPNGINQKATLQSSVSSLQSSSTSSALANTASVPAAVSLRLDEPTMPEKKFNPTEVAFPAGIDSAPFRAAWADWCAYRRERGQTLKPRTAKAQLAEMADWGQADAIAAIRKSIMQGWQGVFKPDANQRKPAHESEFANAFEPDFQQHLHRNTTQQK
jgi:uncharacterized protein YdaU (DUF1376 family)